jgi:hypothetical protein
MIEPQDRLTMAFFLSAAHRPPGPVRFPQASAELWHPSGRGSVMVSWSLEQAYDAYPRIEQEFAAELVHSLASCLTWSPGSA